MIKKKRIVLLNNVFELTVYRLILSSTFFTKVVLLFLLFLSIISWAIMLNKYLFIIRYRSIVTKFFNLMTNQRSIDYIEETCNQFTNSIIRTVPVILIKLIRTQAQGRKVISPESIINNTVMHEANKLQRWMTLLATSASASPLIGLLGTVWGIMYSFININLQGNASIATVAPGISEALTTTIAGLLVAIPAMAGHNLLSIMINNCLDQLERIAQFSGELFTKEIEE